MRAAAYREHDPEQMNRDRKLRNLILVLGDQLDERSAAFDGFDPRADAVWMAEVAHESEKVWVSKPRIAIFLAAMRHFRDALLERGWRVFYRALAVKSADWNGLPGKGTPGETFAAQLAWTIAQTHPEKLIIVEPGEWSVREEITAVARDAGAPLEIRTDRHFLCTAAEFAAHAKGRKQLRMEYFYRKMRVKTGVLMDGTIAEGARRTGLPGMLRLGRVVVVGQSVPVELWTSMPALSEAGRSAVDAAVLSFEQGQGEAAGAAWSRAATDPATTRLAEPFRAAIAAGDADGVLRLRAK